MKCCIPFCNEFNSSTFSVPKNVFHVWQNSLNIKLKSNSRICEKHFKKEDIIRTWVSGSKQENQYTVCIFDYYSYYTTSIGRYLSTIKYHCFSNVN